MSEREFWILVRSALLLFVDAIERRWELESSAAKRRLRKITLLDKK